MLFINNIMMRYDNNEVLITYEFLTVFIIMRKSLNFLFSFNQGTWLSASRPPRLVHVK